MIKGEDECVVETRSVVGAGRVAEMVIELCRARAAAEETAKPLLSGSGRPALAAGG
jgi:hypothetical protein